MTTTEVPIGAKVSVSAGIGIVRWTGSNPPFSSGKWVGVELSEPTGKNDGTVQGMKYFDCKPQHGVFVRPSQVKVLETPKSRPSSTRPPVTPSISRVSSAGPPRAGSPLKKSGPTTPPRSGTSAATQVTSPSTTARKPNVTTRPPSSVFKRPPSVMENVPATTSRRVSSPVKTLDEHMEEFERVSSPVPTERVISPTPSQPASARVVSRGVSGAFSSVGVPPSLPVAGPSSRPASPEKEHSAGFAQKRELEELRIKVKIMEMRKNEDQQKLRELEIRAGEADALKAARVKLQVKFQELQASLVAAQRQARDLQSENTLLESRASEAVDQLEMAALDREVAEEKAEAAEADAVKLNEKLAELEMEIAVLKEENGESQTTEEISERTSLAYIQLEKHNERLKEALIRLRDVSNENEREYKNKLAEVDKELTSQDNLLSQLELAEAKLGNAEAQVEDLKQQLDDALGAEDMLVQLTERNLQISERMEEMRVTIEDLEALKELNDELEETHVEAEKQLNEELDALNIQLRDERKRSNDLDSVVIDMESTITQFRDLVGALQQEIDDLRMQQATQEVEVATNTKEAQAILNMNLKLQSSVVKQQSKTIDLELKKLEVAQLTEHLRIVQVYLPGPYHETDADPTAALLLFHRLSAKVDTLISTISQAHGIPASLHTASSEALVGVCELRGKLGHFSLLNKRFAGVLQRIDSDGWVALGKVIDELGGVEARVDGWIGLVRSDEFSEGDCARELSSLIAQFDHLAATSFDHPTLDLGEQQLGLAYNINYDLDNFAAAVGFARHAILALTQQEDIEVEVGESSLEEGVYEPVQRILDQVRAVKVPSGKLVSEVTELVSKSMALAPDMSVALADLAVAVSNAVDLAVQLAQRIAAHVASLRASKEPLRLEEIEGFLEQLVADSAVPSDAPPWEQIGMFISRLGTDLGLVLPKISELINTVDIPPPWLARVAAIREAATYNADTERKIVKLTEEVKDMLREVKLRDQSLQESGVKVETLERRLEATRKQADIIVELENDVAKAKKQEKVYEDAIAQLQSEQDALEAENARLRKQGGPIDSRQANATSSTMAEPLLLSNVTVGMEVSQLAEQVENLKTAVRFLRNENSLLKSRQLYKDLGFLPTIPYSSPSSSFSPTTWDTPDLVSNKRSNIVGADGSLDSPTSSDDGELPVTPTKITKQSLETNTKLLFRQLAEFQSSPRIVDISQLGGTAWRSKKKSPEWQMTEWRRQEQRLERRLEDLTEQARELERRGR
ncbi:dynactin 1 [Tremella mesenterica]|uniref:Dynactin 1 n=1 Tax=Tremella mesenterica TaxID=5217 RepID=A0A4Q1BU22_TREME|nr:dynactin 1 [Tremella mesenterica]